MCDPRTIGLLIPTLLLPLLLSPSPTPAVTIEDVLTEDDAVQIGFEVRLRPEWWDGLESSRGRENSYSFQRLRARPYLGYDWRNFSVYFEGQYAGALNRPDESPGSGYRGSYNLWGPSEESHWIPPDESRHAVDVIELYLEGRDLFFDGLGFRVGRQALRDGAEVLYDDPVFDWIKEERLSERLIGDWDWSNLGRRYDAVKMNYDHALFHVEAFAARVLSGGVGYGNAYEQLDRVEIAGGAVTLKRGFPLPHTELRVFDYHYRDDRHIGTAPRYPESKQKGSGWSPFETNSAGFSVVGVYPVPGPGSLDLLLWGCYQKGTWQKGHRRSWVENHKAYGGVVEVGYRLGDMPLAPWLRLGGAYASGDTWTDRNRYTDFINMVPDNHKFHGAMDTTAFSNLIDAYFQLILEPGDRLRVQVDGHVFRTASDLAHWHAGSGPFSEDLFGYTTRPVDSRGEIGGEVDVTVAYALSPHLHLEAGYAHFIGWDGATNAYSREEDADWGYLQVTAGF